jgi:hypothetical protein
VVIHSQETKIASAASIDFRGDEAQTLAQISKSLIAKGIKAGKDIESAVSGVNTSEDTDKVADLLTESKGAVILSGCYTQRSVSF